MKNIDLAAITIRKIKSSYIAQPENTTLDVSLLEIGNVYIMTQVSIYDEI